MHEEPETVLEETRDQGWMALWDRDTLVALYVEHGMTYDEVADHVGCSVRTVRRRLADHDIEMRHTGGSGGSQL